MQYNSLLQNNTTPLSPYGQQKEITLESPSQFRQAAVCQPYTSHLPANSHTKSTQKFEGLYFPNERSLVNWLSTQPDLITQAQSLLTAYVSKYKVCSVLFNYKFLDLFL